jgi:hypothetical protein
MTDARRTVGLVLGTMVVLASMARGVGAQSEAVELERKASLPIAAGATLEVRAVKGEASFLAADGAEAVVEYARDVPADVTVVALTTPDGLTLCTVYASSDPMKPTGCSADGKTPLATGKAKDLSRVRLRIRVPAGVHVKATMGEGDLKSMGITGNLHFYAGKGDVLVHDGGGPGTIHAGIGMLGSIDAVIAKEQRGPTLRHVRLESPGSGRVRVGMPVGVSASYMVGTQRPAVIDKVFGVKKVDPPVLNGHLGPSGTSLVRLDVDTGIAGQFMLFPVK